MFAARLDDIVCMTRAGASPRCLSVAPPAAPSGRGTLANLLENGFDTVERLRCIEASTPVRAIARAENSVGVVHPSRAESRWRVCARCLVIIYYYYHRLSLRHRDAECPRRLETADRDDGHAPCSCAPRMTSSGAPRMTSSGAPGAQAEGEVLECPGKCPDRTFSAFWL